MNYQFFSSNILGKGCLESNVDISVWVAGTCLYQDTENSNTHVWLVKCHHFINISNLNNTLREELIVKNLLNDKTQIYRD